MFPNCKEISESVAAYRAVAEYLVDHPGPDLQVAGNAVAICVADGSSPRTAALFSLLTPQEAHSVDPAIHPRFHSEENLVPFGRLKCHPCTAEEFCVQLGKSAPSQRLPPLVIIAAVHSHVMLEDYVPHIRMHFSRSRVVLVAIPCCVDQRLILPSSRHLGHASLSPVVQFNDMAIHSNDRVVRIWDFPSVEELSPSSEERSLSDLFLSLRTNTATSKNTRTKLTAAYAGKTFTSPSSTSSPQPPQEVLTISVPRSC